MRRKLLFIFTLLILINSTLLAQANKEDEFTSPLDIPLILSGTFGELRGNHFHTGIDIKTKGGTGYNVRSIDEGYVSRISVSPSGYGKAIYISHPNGLTSVYAHLDLFAPSIQKFVKEAQYKRKSYRINLYPKKNEIKIKQKQIIAKSGNSGGSAAPHLHFEIRNTANQKPQNPLSFNYKIADSRAPMLNSVHIYEFENKFTKEDTLMQVDIKLNDENKIFEGKENTEVSAGWIGIGVNSIDRLDAASNKNGVYSVKLFVNNKMHFSYAMDELVFSEQLYINSFIDYAYYVENNKRIQKLFLDPNNKLSVYNLYEDDGYIFIEEGKNYDILLIVEDYKGNKTKSRFTIEGKKIERLNTDNKNLLLDFRNENSITTDKFDLIIPKGALYKDYPFEYGFSNGVYRVGNNKIPMHKNYTLSLKLGEIKDSIIASKTIAGKLTDKGDTIYAGGKYADGVLKIRSKSFGDFLVTIDTISPEIKYVNIFDGKWMTKEKFLKVKVTDNFSGIAKYGATIDDKWILMEYDAKNNLLTFDFSDIKLEGKKHKLRIELEDGVGNIKEEEIHFFK